MMQPSEKKEDPCGSFALYRDQFYIDIEKKSLEDAKKRKRRFSMQGLLGGSHITLKEDSRALNRDSKDNINNRGSIGTVIVGHSTSNGHGNAGASSRSSASMIVVTPTASPQQSIRSSAQQRQQQQSSSSSSSPLLDTHHSHSNDNGGSSSILPSTNNRSSNSPSSGRAALAHKNAIYRSTDNTRLDYIIFTCKDETEQKSWMEILQPKVRNT